MPESSESDERSSTGDRPDHEATVSSAGGMYATVTRADGRWPELATRIGELSNGGVPLPASLRSVAGLAADPRHASALNSVADRLDAGVSLGTAVDESELPGSQTLVATLEAGHRGGDLFAVLEPIAQCEDVCDQLRSKITTALIYPICVLFFMAVFGTTAVLVADGVLSSFARDAGYSASRGTLGIAVALIAVPALATVTLAIEVLRTRRTDAVPFEWCAPVKGIVQHARHLRLTSHLAFLIDADVPMPDALSIAGRAAGGDVEADCSLLADTVRQGRTVENLMGQFRSAPPVMRAFLATVQLEGDGRDDLGRSRLAARFRSTSELLGQALKAKLESFDRERLLATTVLLGVGVLGYCLALFGPLVYAYSQSAQEAVNYG